MNEHSIQPIFIVCPIPIKSHKKFFHLLLYFDWVQNDVSPRYGNEWNLTSLTFCHQHDSTTNNNHCQYRIYMRIEKTREQFNKFLCNILSTYFLNNHSLKLRTKVYYANAYCIKFLFHSIWLWLHAFSLFLWNRKFKRNYYSEFHFKAFLWAQCVGCR